MGRFLIGLAWIALCAGCTPRSAAVAVYFAGCTRLDGYEAAIGELEHAVREGLGAAGRAEKTSGAWTLECMVENHGERAVSRLRLFSAPDAHPVWSATFGLELPQREAAMGALASVVERLDRTRGAPE